MRELQDGLAPEGGRLLRVLLVWNEQVPAHANRSEARLLVLKSQKGGSIHWPRHALMADVLIPGRVESRQTDECQAQRTLISRNCIAECCVRAIVLCKLSALQLTS